MIILATIGLLSGLALGLRFKVFILVPAIVLGLAITAVHGIVGEEGVWLLIGKMVVIATSLQLGYACGGTLRFIAATRTADPDGDLTSKSTDGSPSGQLPNSGGAPSRFEAGKQFHRA